MIYVVTMFQLRHIRETVREAEVPVALVLLLEERQNVFTMRGI